MQQPIDSSKKRTDDPGHGWFQINGLQSGERVLDTQMEGLIELLETCQGQTVLDLGCAEGLVGIEFAKAGSGLVTGIDSVVTRIETAKRLAGKQQLNCQFSVADLARMDFPAMTPRDIVLALSIAQKMPAPDKWISWIGRLARRTLVLRLPHPIISDRRSDFREINPAEVLKADFERTCLQQNSRGEWLMIFERRP